MQRCDKCERDDPWADPAYHEYDFHCKEEARSCQECSQTFESRTSLLYHQRFEGFHKRIEPRDAGVCNVCDPPKRPREFARHNYNEHLPLEDRTCPKCSKVFISFRGLLRHLASCKRGEDREVASVRNVYLLKTSCCDECGHRKFAKDPLYHAYNFHCDGAQRTCNLCAEMYVSRRQLELHQRQHIDPELVGTCILCNPPKKCGQLTRHVYQYHLPDDARTCTICKTTAPTIHGLLSHISSAHKTFPEGPVASDTWVCKICKTALPTMESLLSHIHSTHKSPPVGPVACETCQHMFRSPIGLKVHLKFGCHGYVLPKILLCEVCDPCQRIENVEKHNADFHCDVGERTCMYCGKQFDSRGIMRKHRCRIYGNVCYQCDPPREFKSLGSHRSRFHCREFDRMCHECDIVFSSTERLRMHYKKKCPHTHFIE